MFVHATDALPIHQAALNPPAVVMTADASDISRLMAPNRAIAAGAGEWRATEVPGVEGLCFVRRGSGEWKGLITVCEGRVSTLGAMAKPSLDAVALKVSGDAGGFRSASETASPRGAHLDLTVWQRWAAWFLLAAGLGLAVKSGSMMLDGMKKYG